MGFCDFHVHSTASDGRLSPSRLAEEAAAAGLDGFALADHDTLAGVPEAVSRSRELGILCVPAVELSVDLHSGGSAHLLGYFPGIEPEELLAPEAELAGALSFIIQGREARNPAIVQKFRELGFDISMEEVEAEAGGSVVGRPHIAAVMVKRGFASSSSEVFDRYLGSGRPAYVERSRLGDFRAIEIIRQTGGLPVLAHPAYIPTEGYAGLDALIGSLADAGLSGLEAYYPEHSREMTSFLKLTAERRGLFLTGGSDFHGIKHPIPGWRDGSFGVETEKVSGFMDYCREKERKANGETQ